MSDSRITNLQTNRFIRNALTGRDNRIDSPFLSKLDNRIYSIGEYIKQRHGLQAFDDLVNFVFPTAKTMSYEEGVKVIG